MALTLLQVVQSILPRIHADDVNSINDTPDARQAATVAVQVYKDLISNKVIPNNQRLIKIQASGDSTQPTHMKLPEDVATLDNMTVRYNTKQKTTDADEFTLIPYVDPQEFLRRTNTLRSTDSTTSVITDALSQPGGTTFMVANNSAPTCYTTFDDVWLIFDSWDNSLESTLQNAKTQVHAEVFPRLTINDTTVVPVPPTVESLYVNKCIVACQQMEEINDQHTIREVRKQEQAAVNRSRRMKGRIRINPIFR